MKTTASDFDKKFDDDKNVSQHLDLSKAKRPGCQTKRANVDFPEWMIICLDKEAQRLGITRQSVIKFWIAEKLSARQKE